MAFHHVAIAAKDLEASHRFYSESCGFELVKVDAAPTPEGGWARHLFYDTGDGTMLALWDLHVDALGDFPTGISTGLGLPDWVNHIAFGAADLDAIGVARDRWIAHGHEVVEIDHGWCTSVYAKDPNDVTVEFCTTTATFGAAEREEAQRRLTAEIPDFDEGAKSMRFYLTDGSVLTA